jgi:Ran GTPase-activating protein (RanGAP) involved in mRNA processing and transport
MYPAAPLPTSDDTRAPMVIVDDLEVSSEQKDDTSAATMPAPAIEAKPEQLEQEEKSLEELPSEDEDKPRDEDKDEKYTFVTVLEPMRRNSIVYFHPEWGEEVTGAQKQAFAKILQSNTSLRTIEIWSCNWDNTGATFLADALKFNRHLTALGLQDNDIDAIGAQSICKVLENENKTLLKLDLFFDQIGDLGALAISNMLKTNRTLTDLRVEGCGINFTGMCDLLKALATNSTLTKLNAEDNNFKPDGKETFERYQEFITVLSNNRALRTLNLALCSITPLGGHAIGYAVAKNQGLQKLLLHGNSIGYQGYDALSKALRGNDKLQYLRIGENTFVPSYVSLLFAALPIKATLQHLDLSDEESCEAASFDPNVRSELNAQVYLALKNNRTLTKIALPNVSDPKNVDDVLEVLESNRTLRHIYIGNVEDHKKINDKVNANASFCRAYTRGMENTFLQSTELPAVVVSLIIGYCEGWFPSTSEVELAAKRVEVSQLQGQLLNQEIIQWMFATQQIYMQENYAHATQIAEMAEALHQQLQASTTKSSNNHRALSFHAPRHVSACFFPSFEEEVEEKRDKAEKRKKSSSSSSSSTSAGLFGQAANFEDGTNTKKHKVHGKLKGSSS